jgi:hypothetical protein
MLLEAGASRSGQHSRSVQALPVVFQTAKVMPKQKDRTIENEF